MFCIEAPPAILSYSTSGSYEPCSLYMLFPTISSGLALVKCLCRICEATYPRCALCIESRKRKTDAIAFSRTHILCFMCKPQKGMSKIYTIHPRWSIEARRTVLSNLDLSNTAQQTPLKFGSPTLFDMTSVTLVV